VRYSDTEITSRVGFGVYGIMMSDKTKTVDCITVAIHRNKYIGVEFQQRLDDYDGTLVFYMPRMTIKLKRSYTELFICNTYKNISHKVGCLWIVDSFTAAYYIRCVQRVVIVFFCCDSSSNNSELDMKAFLLYYLSEYEGSRTTMILIGDFYKCFNCDKCNWFNMFSAKDLKLKLVTYPNAKTLGYTRNLDRIDFCPQIDVIREEEGSGEICKQIIVKV
jgi:hypothetical protein